MTKLLIATNNPHKLQEYEEILASLPLTSLAQEGISQEIGETGTTFVDNAIMKAREYARLSGLLTLADDSGLEVDALGGEPGVLSSRYAGPGASDEDRYNLLLKKLEGVPWEKRGARFRCVTAIASPTGEVQVVEGKCEGIITFRPRGQHGFGYDPVFYIPEQGCTMAELPPRVKNQISHRGRAGQKARELLLGIIECGETSEV